LAFPLPTLTSLCEGLFGQYSLTPPPFPS
jgi:hypothetical protein